LGLDPNAGEHRDNCLIDRLIIGVAVVRTVIIDLEPTGITGFGEKLL
jgi:hypothetical protein